MGVLKVVGKKQVVFLKCRFMSATVKEGDKTVASENANNVRENARAIHVRREICFLLLLWPDHVQSIMIDERRRYFARFVGVRRSGNKNVQFSSERDDLFYFHKYPVSPGYPGIPWPRYWPYSIFAGAEDVDMLHHFWLWLAAPHRNAICARRHSVIQNTYR